MAGLACRASLTPSTTTPHPWSPPITSTTIRIFKRARILALPLSLLKGEGSPQCDSTPQRSPLGPGVLYKTHKQDKPDAGRTERHIVGRCSTAAVSRHCCRPAASAAGSLTVFAWVHP